MRTVVTGLCLIGLSFLLIWLFDIDVQDGKFGAGLASIPGVIGAWMVWSPIRRAIWDEE